MRFARSVAAAASAAGLGVAVACAPSSSPAPEARSSAAPATSRLTASRAPTTPDPTTTTPRPVDEAGWTIKSIVDGRIAIDARTVSEPDGSTVELLRFRAGLTRFELHVGRVDPPVGSTQLPANSQPALNAGERPSVIGAFNGGFKSSAGVGGVEIDGRVVTPLRNGEASLAVGPNGTPRIGIWGQGFPPTGAAIPSVLQNLPPIVMAGVPSSQINDPRAWGATLGGGSVVARSALGEDPSGDLVYAASMHTLPVDLASAPISVRCVVAMELDINPEWVQADTAPAPGLALATQVPGQTRPANQYLDGWTHDFVVVLAG